MHGVLLPAVDLSTRIDMLSAVEYQARDFWRISLILLHTYHYFLELKMSGFLEEDTVTQNFETQIRVNRYGPYHSPNKKNIKP